MGQINHCIKTSCDKNCEIDIKYLRVADRSLVVDVLIDRIPLERVLSCKGSPSFLSGILISTLNSRLESLIKSVFFFLEGRHDTHLSNQSAPCSQCTDILLKKSSLPLLNEASPVPSPLSRYSDPCVTQMSWDLLQRFLESDVFNSNPFLPVSYLS